MVGNYAVGGFPVAGRSNPTLYVKTVSALQVNATTSPSLITKYLANPNNCILISSSNQPSIFAKSYFPPLDAYSYTASSSPSISFYTSLFVNNSKQNFFIESPNLLFSAFASAGSAIIFSNATQPFLSAKINFLPTDCITVQSSQSPQVIFLGKSIPADAVQFNKFSIPRLFSISRPPPQSRTIATIKKDRSVATFIGIRIAS